MLNKIHSLYKELGAGPMSDYLARRLLGAIGISLNRYRLLVQPVPDKAWLPERPGNPIEIREVAQDDYRLAWFPRPEHAIHDRYAQGARCWVAFKGEMAVACQWLLAGPFREDEVRCRFLPMPQGEAAWDFDVYIRPELRLGRLFLMLWDNSNAWLREQGIRWTASRVDTLNLQSLRSHQRMGAREVGTAWFVSIGSWQLSRSPDGWAFSTDADHGPDIHLRPPAPAGDPSRAMESD